MDLTFYLGYLATALICGLIFVFYLRREENHRDLSKTEVSGRDWEIISFRSLRAFVVTNREQCLEACFQLRRHCEVLKVLGFDCEWVSQRPVALIQLATVRGFCCLFRLNILAAIPVELERILSDSTILKLGVSPLNDSELLFRDYKIQVCSTLDLRYLYPNCGGLASMASSVIGEHLDKRFQCSNWESNELSLPQIYYAAKDAYVAIEIFNKWLMTASKNGFYPDAYEDLKPKLSKYLDVNFKQNYSALIQNVKAHVPEGLSYENKKKNKSGCATRKAPLYHNCFMHAPDGELLCSCDKRKAQWYVDRGLAEVLPGEPYSIKLLFEPAARAGNTNGGRFYQQLKQNCCVVCGAHQSYLKHHVVPQEYRKHLPNFMKDHQSHDVVLMCLTCHKIATQHNELLRKKLAVHCNAPINSSKVSQIRNAQKVKNSAKALLVAGDALPKERKDFLENILKAHFKVHELPIQLLEAAANIATKISNENCKSHGVKVVNYFDKHYGLEKLKILWREHFISTMNPQYLPALWSVTHNNYR